MTGHIIIQSICSKNPLPFGAARKPFRQLLAVCSFVIETSYSPRGCLWISFLSDVYLTPPDEFLAVHSGI